MLCDEDDIANFHLALAAREVRPELRLVVRLFNLELGAQAEQLLRIVLRLFDPDLAGRVERVAGLGVSRSVSDLAAPAFAAAALGRDVTDAIRTRHGLLLVARAGSLEGSVSDVERDGSLRVLSRERNGRVTWAPGGEERIEPGDRATVIGTQVGLAGLSGA